MNKKVAYTVCSANHLAYAKTMADSFIKFHKGYQVIIGLVDQIDNKFDISFFQPHVIVEVEKLCIPEFAKMSRQYTIIELNCAIKPFLAQYIFKEQQPEILLYIDTDIHFYHTLLSIEDLLQQHNIVLTPHITTPIGDDKRPFERDILRSGIYNAGFIGMKKSKTVDDFLNWWSERLMDQCYYNFAEGMGVDQNWLNLVPLFFNKVAICNDEGCNVAYWNLHERCLTLHEDNVFINDKTPLQFLHISGYKFETPEILSRHQTRFNLKELPVLKALLNDYTNKVLQNKYKEFSILPCFYAKPPQKSTGIMAFVNSLLKPLKIKISSL